MMTLVCIYVLNDEKGGKPVRAAVVVQSINRKRGMDDDGIVQVGNYKPRAERQASQDLTFPRQAGLVWFGLALAWLVRLTPVGSGMR